MKGELGVDLLSVIAGGRQGLNVSERHCLNGHLPLFCRVDMDRAVEAAVFSTSSLLLLVSALPEFVALLDLELSTALSSTLVLVEGADPKYNLTQPNMLYY